MADAAGGWADDCPERHRLPCCGGRSHESQTVSARRMGGSDAGGDGALAAATGLPFEAGDASGLGLFSVSSSVHYGPLERSGPVAWLTVIRIGFRAPLDRGI